MFNCNLDLGMKSELSIFLGLTKVEAPKTPQRRRTKNIFNVESRKDAVRFRKYLYDTICRHPRTVYDLMFLYKRGRSTILHHLHILREAGKIEKVESTYPHQYRKA